MTSVSYDVFISYRHSDGSDVAQVLRLALEKKGYKVFLDVRDLPAGEFDKNLRETILSTPNFIPILTPDAVRIGVPEDDWFLKEVEAAFSSETKICPVVCEPLDLSKLQNLPSPLDRLRMHNAIHYSNYYSDAAVDKLCAILIKPPDSLSPPALETAPKRMRPRNAAGLITLVIAVALITGKMLVENSGFGRQLDQFAYNLVQWRLPSPTLDDDVPIVIIDITDLARESRIVCGRSVPITSRPHLRELVTAIVEAHPKAIAIDVDFSTECGNYIDSTNDPVFFQQCLTIRHTNGIPLFLGNYRQLTNNPDFCFGKPEFTELAATLRIPMENRRLPLWDQAVGANRRLPALGAALLAEADTRLPKPPDYLSWAVETVAERDVGSRLRSAEFFINFSPVHILEKERLQVTNATAIPPLRHRITDRYVLIGCGTFGQVTDTFVVPGQIDPVPGVYLHACAIYTLLSGVPFYELRPLGRLALDAFLVVIVMASVARISRLHRLSEAEGKSVHRQLTWIVIGFVMLVGVGLVRFIHLIWLDFLLVSIALLLHTPIEKIAINLFEWFVNEWQKLVHSGDTRTK